MERKAMSGEPKRKETKPRREPPPSSTSAAADDADEEEEEEDPPAAAAVAVAVAAEEEKKRRSGSSSTSVTSSVAGARRGAAAAAAAGTAGATAPPSCQAERCAADLTEAKRYHRRHKVCEAHSKSPVVVVAGLRQRFCQQCSRSRCSMSYQSSMTLKGAAAGAWPAITSGAERVLWRLREKARAAAGSPIRMEGFRSTSLETLRLSISRSDKHALSLLSCYAASNCANCCPMSLLKKCIAVIAKLNALV